MVSDHNIYTLYLSSLTSPRRSSEHQWLKDNPCEEKDQVHFPDFGTPSYGEHIFQKPAGYGAVSNRSNDHLDVILSTSTASQPLTIMTVIVRPAASAPKQSDTTRSRPSLRPSISYYLHHSPKPNFKAPAAAVSTVDSVYSEQCCNLAYLCTSCESTADLHLLVNNRKNSLFGE